LIGLKSATYPTEPKDQQPFVVALIGELVKKVLGRESVFSVKIWTVEKRRMARNSNEILIPGVEVTFPGQSKEALEFRRGAANRAKSKEPGFEGVYFSLYVGLTTRIRVEVMSIMMC
jgi:hypothetical protein